MKIRYCERCSHPEHIHDDEGCDYGLDCGLGYVCKCKKFIRRYVGVDGK